MTALPEETDAFAAELRPLRARYFGTVIALAFTWQAVLFISLLSPDLVYGGRQEHLPIAALTAWVWGVLASGSLAIPLAVRAREHPAMWWWVLLGVGTGVIWVTATCVSVFTPRLVTGADPTRVPLGALVAPAIAAAATASWAIFVAAASRTGASPEETPD